MTTSLWSVLWMVEVATRFVKWWGCTISLQITIHIHTQDFSRKSFMLRPHLNMLWQNTLQYHHMRERWHLKSSATLVSANKQRNAQDSDYLALCEENTVVTRGAANAEEFPCHDVRMPWPASTYMGRPIYVIHMIKHWTSETSTFVINRWRITSISDH